MEGRGTDRLVEVLCSCERFEVRGHEYTNERVKTDWKKKHWGASVVRTNDSKIQVNVLTFLD